MRSRHSVPVETYASQFVMSIDCLLKDHGWCRGFGLMLPLRVCDCVCHHPESIPYWPPSRAAL
jgi:hypothetical protein